MNIQVFLCLCALTGCSPKEEKELDEGVSGAEAKEQKQVSVTEWQTVTLSTGVSVEKTGDQIIWYSGSKNRKIAQIRAGETPNYDYTYSDRLHMNQTSGDLNIPNVTSEHTGLCSVQIIINGTVSWKIFNITVLPHLPDPVITTDCPQNSTNPQCVPSCSVKNGSPGQTLSWYQNHSLVSNKSLSDPNTGFSLSLKVDCQDKNIYSCVVSNSLTNKTTLFNSTHHCQHSEAKTFKYFGIVLGAVVLGAVVLVLGAVGGYCCYKKRRQTNQEGHGQIELQEVVSEEEGALHNNDTGNGTHRRENFPETNTPLINEETNNSILVQSEKQI